ncbi:MAG: hypothetical protein J3R72DRAFT_240427 [Linnemannia gamsii]|nr:MAG: hypothetical protein J3R72DRAFT_240427 [Linnemannia gamsii]
MIWRPVCNFLIVFCTKKRAVPSGTRFHSCQGESPSPHPPKKFVAPIHSILRRVKGEKERVGVFSESGIRLRQCKQDFVSELFFLCLFFFFLSRANKRDPRMTKKGCKARKRGTKGRPQSNKQQEKSLFDINNGRFGDNNNSNSSLFPRNNHDHLQSNQCRGSIGSRPYLFTFVRFD